MNSSRSGRYPRSSPRTRRMQLNILFAFKTQPFSRRLVNSTSPQAPILSPTIATIPRTPSILFAASTPLEYRRDSTRDCQSRSRRRRPRRRSGKPRPPRRPCPGFWNARQSPTTCIRPWAIVHIPPSGPARDSRGNVRRRSPLWKTGRFSGKHRLRFPPPPGRNAPGDPCRHAPPPPPATAAMGPTPAARPAATMSRTMDAAGSSDGQGDSGGREIRPPFDMGLQISPMSQDRFTGDLAQVPVRVHRQVRLLDRHPEKRHPLVFHQIAICSLPVLFHAPSHVQRRGSQMLGAIAQKVAVGHPGDEVPDNLLAPVLFGIPSAAISFRKWVNIFDPRLSVSKSSRNLSNSMGKRVRIER